MTGRLAALVATAFLAAGALPAAGVADGLPVLGIDVGSEGAAAVVLAVLLLAAAWFGLRRARRRPGPAASDPRPAA